MALYTTEQTVHSIKYSMSEFSQSSINYVFGNFRLQLKKPSIPIYVDTNRRTYNIMKKQGSMPFVLIDSISFQVQEEEAAYASVPATWKLSLIITIACIVNEKRGRGHVQLSLTTSLSLPA